MNKIKTARFEFKFHPTIDSDYKHILPHQSSRPCSHPRFRINEQRRMIHNRDARYRIGIQAPCILAFVLVLKLDRMTASWLNQCSFTLAIWACECCMKLAPTIVFIEKRRKYIKGDSLPHILVHPNL